MIFVFFPTENNIVSSFGASYISLVYSIPVHLYCTKYLETGISLIPDSKFYASLIWLTFYHRIISRIFPCGIFRNSFF